MFSGNAHNRHNSETMPDKRGGTFLCEVKQPNENSEEQNEQLAGLLVRDLWRALNGKEQILNLL